MFGDDNEIRYPDPNDGKGSLKGVAIATALGALVTAASVTEFWKDKDGEKFTSGLTPNEMFCRNPEFDIDFRGDPFRYLNPHAGDSDYSALWHTMSGHKIVSVHLDYNEVDLKRRADYFREILKDVIDDPSVTFIISGHATYDLDDKYPFLNVQTPKGFDDEHQKHMRNNFKIAAQRIKSTREVLESIGIDPSRIVKEINHGVRYDKRAVDLEVCVPQATQP